MRISRTLDTLEQSFPMPFESGTAVTIGNFDGVHLGHQLLLERTRTSAEEQGTKAVAITFDPHPLNVLTPYAPPLLTTTQTRLALLESMGMDMVLLLTFTRELAAMPPDVFVQRILVNRLRIRDLYLGYDFSLGKGRSGTPEMLSELGRKAGFRVTQLEALGIHDDVVSSTRIRELLHQGQVWEASTLLGRPYSVQGEVIPGKQRGRLLGFPTANLAPMPVMLPRPGVYATYAFVCEGTKSGLPSFLSLSSRPSSAIPAVTNIGHNPTFGRASLTIETHLIDFEEDLYGKHLEVAFVERLRGEITFTGADALMTQIQKDVSSARKITGVRG